MAVGLAAISVARTRLQALRARSLPARAARARQLRTVETAGRARLIQLTPYARNRLAVRRLTDALGAEASAWDALARAATSNRRPAYATARRSLLAAGRRLAVAAGGLRQEGFSVPSLRSLTIAPVPAVVKHPASPTTTRPVAGTGPSGTASNATGGTTTGTTGAGKQTPTKSPPKQPASKGSGGSVFGKAVTEDLK